VCDKVGVDLFIAKVRVPTITER